tara:strand:- start:625 stop:1107 length:483 start_codon:yes stop_codon:yes gene_type:complete
MQKIKGIWLYGLAGSGKTYASSFLKKIKKNSFVIDGHKIREIISSDLKYDLKSRIIQLNRLYGIALLAIYNGYFPIISSVYIDNNIIKKLKKKKIISIKITRNIKTLKKIRPIYQKSKNVVGKDIFYKNIKHKEILNNSKKELYLSLMKMINLKPIKRFN